MDPFVIGIDPGTACGWAVLDLGTGKHIASGTLDLASRRHEGGGMRYLRAERWLTEVLDGYGATVTAVVYEEVSSHKGTAAAHVYGGLVAIFAKLCEQRGVPYAGVPVGTVKKHATGKGNANKEAMVAAARARWGYPLDVTADDEADALWVADTFRMGKA